MLYLRGVGAVERKCMTVLHEGAAAAQPQSALRDEPKADYRQDAPIVQAKKIIKYAPRSFGVTIACCYCFKEHEHGPGSDVSNEVPDDLGHRAPHCSLNGTRHFCPGYYVGYRISTKAWKAAGRKIEQKKSGVIGGTGGKRKKRARMDAE